MARFINIDESRGHKAHVYKPFPVYDDWQLFQLFDREGLLFLCNLVANNMPAYNDNRGVPIPGAAPGF